MLKLSICVVATSNNTTYFNYLKSISPHYDELIIISDYDEENTFDINIEKLKYEYVSQLTSSHINNVLQNANGDWILWLHEGDKIDEHDLFRLRDWLYTLNGQIGLTQVISARHQAVGLFKNSDAPVPRLFKNSINFAYYTPQIELLDFSSIEQGDSVQLCGIRIYSANTSQIVDKLNAGFLQQLEHSLSIEANHFSYYHAAYECYKWQKFNRATQYINDAIFQFASKNEVPPAYFYKLKYACLVEGNNDEDSLKGLKLILKLYPNHTELYFYMAILYFKLNRIKQARENFFYCISLGNQTKELTKKGVGTYLASFYIALCYEKEQNLKQATQYYNNALLLNPSYKAANKALERISSNQLTT